LGCGLDAGEGEQGGGVGQLGGDLAGERPAEERHRQAPRGVDAVAVQGQVGEPQGGAGEGEARRGRRLDCRAAERLAPEGQRDPALRCARQALGRDVGVQIDGFGRTDAGLAQGEASLERGIGERPGKGGRNPAAAAERDPGQGLELAQGGQHGGQIAGEQAGRQVEGQAAAEATDLRFELEVVEAQTLVCPEGETAVQARRRAEQGGEGRIGQFERIEAQRQGAVEAGGRIGRANRCLSAGLAGDLQADQRGKAGEPGEREAGLQLQVAGEADAAGDSELHLLAGRGGVRELDPFSCEIEPARGLNHQGTVE